MNLRHTISSARPRRYGAGVRPDSFTNPANRRTPDLRTSDGLWLAPFPLIDDPARIRLRRDDPNHVSVQIGCRSPAAAVDRRSSG
jgi:hypothetical protein